MTGGRGEVVLAGIDRAGRCCDFGGRAGEPSEVRADLWDLSVAGSRTKSRASSRWSMV